MARARGGRLTAQRQRAPFEARRLPERGGQLGRRQAQGLLGERLVGEWRDTLHQSEPLDGVPREDLAQRLGEGHAERRTNKTGEGGGRHQCEPLVLDDDADGRGGIRVHLHGGAELHQPVGQRGQAEAGQPGSTLRFVMRPHALAQGLPALRLVEVALVGVDDLVLLRERRALRPEEGQLPRQLHPAHETTSSTTGGVKRCAPTRTVNR